MAHRFRTGDRITVFGFLRTEGRPVRGRVICDNRTSKYHESVTVLVDLGDHEAVENFKPDGRRYLSTSSCYILPGWHDES